MRQAASEKIRSLTRVEARSIAESKEAVGIAGLGTTVFGTEILVGVSRSGSSVRNPVEGERDSGLKPNTTPL